MQIQRWMVVTLATLGLLLTSAQLDGAGPAPAEQAQAEVEGFQVDYPVIATPETEWGTASEELWITGFRGRLRAAHALSYRGGNLPAGEHDVWVEKGSGEWFHLFVGDRDNEEAPRLRAIFKLYEQEQGAGSLHLELRRTRRGTKLKFSLTAGRSEGHGNFRVVDPKPDAKG